jgi:beta-lactamase regulating signal transducer with metallopeptidase domain
MNINLLNDLHPILDWLLKNSIRSSLLILLVLGCQWIFSSWLTARWRYAFWPIVLASLLLPFHLPSKFSILNLAPVSQLSTTSVSQPSPEAKHSSKTATTSDRSRIENKEELALSSAAEPVPATTPRPTLTPSTPPTSHSFSLSLIQKLKENKQTLLILGWLSGASIFALWFLFPIAQLLFRVRRQSPITDSVILDLLEACKKEMNLQTPIWVVETSRIHSPVLMGFLRPRLLLPLGIREKFSPEELRYIFLHELGHVKQYDIVLNWISTILLILHWFNPLLWFAFARMRVDREAACDALVLTYTRDNENEFYGNTILKLLENFAANHRPLTAVAGILETKQHLKYRFSAIARFKKTGVLWGALPATLLLVLAVTGLTVAQDKSKKIDQRPHAEEKTEKETAEKTLNPALVDSIHMEMRFLAMSNETADEIIAFDQENKTSVALKEATLERIRELEKKKKITVVASPKIIARDGESSATLLTKEFIYPSQYTDPSFEDRGKNNNSNIPPKIVLPSPTAFSTRNLGTILDVRPHLSQDRKRISLCLVPEIVSLAGKTKFQVLIPGKEPFYEEQPTLSKRTFKTALNIPSRSSVLLGRMRVLDDQISKERPDFKTMLMVLTAATEGISSPVTTSTETSKVPSTVFIQAKLIAMERETARDVLRQESGLQNIEVNPRVLDGINLSIRANKTEVIDDIALLVTPEPESSHTGQLLLLSTREIIYPATWNAPLVSGGVEIGATPTEFSTREVGTILDIKKIEIRDDSTIDAAVNLEVVDDGLTNDYFAIDRMPLFSTRVLNTKLILQSGRAVIIGGGEAPESTKKAHPNEDWLMFTILKATTYTP